MAQHICRLPPVFMRACDLSMLFVVCVEPCVCTGWAPLCLALGTIARGVSTCVVIHLPCSGCSLWCCVLLLVSGVEAWSARRAARGVESTFDSGVTAWSGARAQPRMASPAPRHALGGGCVCHA